MSPPTLTEEDLGLLPDMTAITTREPEIPTLSMDPAQLSLSGLIEQFAVGDPQLDAVGVQDIKPLPTSGAAIEVPAGTIAGQNQAITVQLTYPVPTEPRQDIKDMINGFTGQAWPNHADMAGHQQQGQIQMVPAMALEKPYVKILEEPKSNSLRFRYQCEGRGAGALQGIHSTPEQKTFPKIQVCNYKGPAVVVVSCVTEQSPHKAHPHNLVGRDGCKKGVCTMNINNDDMTVEFQHLGIQCVRRKDISESLKQRKDIRVDPFRQGFRHMDNPQGIDLNAVRLCFQVFLEGSTQGKYTEILQPVVSRPIYDAKAKRELQIMDISDTTAPAEGGKKIIILCEKVVRDDIKVRFYESDGSWEGWGDFNPSEVHKQYAISFKAPRYRDGNICERRQVLVELVKPSDESQSEPQDFSFLPSERAQSSGTKRDKENSGLDSGKLQIPYKMTGGGFVTEDDKDNMGIKRESGEAAEAGMWESMTGQVQPMMHPNKPRTPYSQVGYERGGMVLKDNLQGYNMSQPAGGVTYANMGTINYIPNIPVVSQPHMQQQQQQPQYQYYTAANSPPSQQLTDLNLASPAPGHQQEMQQLLDDDVQKYLAQDGDVDNLSGKLDESLSLGETNNLGATAAAAPVERSAGKRSSKDAALESGSKVVPRQAPNLDRQQSSIHTPDVSRELSDIVNAARSYNNL